MLEASLSKKGTFLIPDMDTEMPSFVRHPGLTIVANIYRIRASRPIWGEVDVFHPTCHFVGYVVLLQVAATCVIVWLLERDLRYPGRNVMQIKVIWPIRRKLLRGKAKLRKGKSNRLTSCVDEPYRPHTTLR